MENFTPNQPEKTEQDQKGRYAELVTKSYEATSEDESIEIACESIELQRAMHGADSSALVYIAGGDNNAETDHAAEVARKIKAIYEQKGHTVHVMRDIADPREFYFSIDSDVTPYDEFV